MIAGRNRHNGAGLLRRRQRGEGMIGLTKLEGSDALKVLALQEHGRAGSLTQCARCKNRRHVSDAMEDPSSVLNVSERGHADPCLTQSHVVADCFGEEVFDPPAWVE